MMTHWIPSDAPKLGRERRALCGALVSRSSGEPTCPECRARLEADERALLELVAMGPAAHPVAPQYPEYFLGGRRRRRAKFHL
jgi:hypothetical protein